MLSSLRPDRACRALVAAALALPAATALGQARCRVEPFNGASQPTGAVAQMSVVNDVKYCAITNFGIPGERRNPADSGTVLVAPSHGKAVFVAPQVQYTPEPGYVGEDEFQYEAWARGNINQQIRMLVTVKVTVRAP